MISTELQKAREYEAAESVRVDSSERPAYHFSPRIGWLNDPNGFSYYEGRYHLFYQYHPYNTYWGPMHWGHAVSEDLISWDYLPCALAPDADYDKAGCFSGSEVTLPDGRQLLMYTSCEADGQDPDGRWRQSQSIAVSTVMPDGSTEFVKYDGNPVLTGRDLPDGGDPYEFRDPYIWKTESGYSALIANAVTTGNKATQLCLYRSPDGFSWELDKVLYEDHQRIGVMWECPNFLSMDGEQVIIASPMDMETEEADGSIRFPKGNNVCYIVGNYDEITRTFAPRETRSHEKPGAGAVAAYHPVDCGLDFYAPQVLKAHDGRHIMIGWMQDPSTANLHKDEDFRVFGQMTVPRELSLRDGRLLQRPITELDALRHGKVTYTDVRLGAGSEACREAQGVHYLNNGSSVLLDGVSGRVLDMEISVRPKRQSSIGDSSLDEFTLRFASDGEHYTELSYRPDSSVLTIDRSHSGWLGRISGKRSVRVRDREGTIDLRILLDRWSAEIFVNGGEQVMSLTYYSDLSADKISFSCTGSAIMSIKSYRMDTVKA